MRTLRLNEDTWWRHQASSPVWLERRRGDRSEQRKVGEKPPGVCQKASRVFHRQWGTIRGVCAREWSRQSHGGQASKSTSQISGPRLSPCSLQLTCTCLWWIMSIRGSNQRFLSKWLFRLRSWSRGIADHPSTYRSDAIQKYAHRASFLLAPHSTGMSQECRKVNRSWTQSHSLKDSTKKKAQMTTEKINNGFPGLE